MCVCVCVCVCGFACQQRVLTFPGPGYLLAISACVCIYIHYGYIHYGYIYTIYVCVYIYKALIVSLERN